MARNPFDPSFDKLPPSLPIFPLPKAVLIPAAQLPLNIFEPRYLRMIFDALRAERMIGMIQPHPAAKPGSDTTALVRTGCAGRVSSFTETDDGRLIIVLTGVCRFDIADEIPTTRGYRRFAIDWQRFRADCEPPTNETSLDRDRLLQALRRYLHECELELDWSALERLGTRSMVNFLCMNLPLPAQDKQALLEAITLTQRGELLIALLELALAGGEKANRTRH